jgi:putative (di)nucleoside polyphosphate hydrolase
VTLVPRDDKAYRPCVAVTLFNSQGLVLVAERIDLEDAAWQLPQGGIDDGETASEAALRELEEEIGTRAATIVGEVASWISYDFPADVARQRWRGRYLGQRVKMLALKFDGSDDDINLATNSPEFRAWKWTELEKLPDLIVPFKRPLYDAAVSAFASLRDALRNQR